MLLADLVDQAGGEPARQARLRDRWTEMVEEFLRPGVRMPVSFEPEQIARLKQEARRRRMSVAALVREAVDHFIAAQ